MRTILNFFIILLSLCTATGVFIHDARIDRATSIVHDHVVRRAIQSGTDIGIASDVHTHPEKTGRTLNGFAYQSPSHPPREQKMKRYLQQKIEPRGRHAFDSYYLPIVG